MTQLRTKISGITLILKKIQAKISGNSVGSFIAYRSINQRDKCLIGKTEMDACKRIDGHMMIESVAP